MVSFFQIWDEKNIAMIVNLYHFDFLENRLHVFKSFDFFSNFTSLLKLNSFTSIFQVLNDIIEHWIHQNLLLQMILTVVLLSLCHLVSLHLMKHQLSHVTVHAHNFWIRFLTILFIPVRFCTTTTANFEVCFIGN